MFATRPIMNDQCFYRNENCSQKMSREHIISATVLKVVFGDPIRNSVKAEFRGNKTLLDHEHVVKDICQRCNQNLSPYDTAGAELAKELDTFYDASNKTIPFSSEILGWIIKTHLNHLRIIKDRETNQIYPIDDEIKHNLISFQPLPLNKFFLLYNAIEGTDFFWDAESPRKENYFNYRSYRLKEQGIVISDFRFKTFRTWLVIPWDANYHDFESRTKSALDEVRRNYGHNLEPIDTKDCIENKSLNLKNIIPLSSLKSINPKA